MYKQLLAIQILVVVFDCIYQYLFVYLVYSTMQSVTDIILH